MRKLLLAILSFLLVVSVTAPARADYVVVYGGENPDNDQTNMQPRFERLMTGTLLRDTITDTLVTTGAWSNMAITPASGLHVTVNIGSEPGDGLLYQAANLSTITPVSYPAGYSGNQLPADTTQVVVPYWLNTNSGSIGPLTAPGAGDYAYYLIQGQGQTGCVGYPSSSPYYACQQNPMFVSTNGNQTFPTTNMQVNDTISFQAVEGSVQSGTCPGTLSLPAPSAGYTAIGYVCIQNGDTSISSGRITMYSGTNYNGSSFSAVTFGGNYLNSNNAGDSPSTLSTNDLGTCGINSGTGAKGFVINNAASSNNGNHILAADINGNLNVCGTTLTIFDQNSNTSVPTINVDTPMDTGTNRTDSLYPASGTGVYKVSPSVACSAGTYCTPQTGFQICASGPANTPNAAFVSPTSDVSGFLITAISVTTAAYATGGFELIVYNGSGSSIATGSSFNYSYVCL